MKRKNLLFSLLLVLIGAGLAFAQSATTELKTTSPADGAKAYYQLLRQNQETGQIDATAVRNARARVAKHKQKNTKGLGLNWSSIGPDNIGGRTRAILIDNANASTLYAGSAGGGVWKSTTGGSSWVPMTVNGSTASAITVSCMVQASTGAIYAGTGESWYDPDGGLGPGGFIGTGLYKSTDGMDFSVIGGTENWEFINEICIDQTSGRIYVATSEGLLYTDDEQNWNLAKDNNGNDLDGNAEDVCIGSNGIIVAAVDQLAYVSETGDPNSFVNHSTGAADKLPNTNVSRIEFDIAPSNPDYIYAIAASDIGILRGVYRSIDKGQTWDIIGPGNSQQFAVFTYASNGSLSYIGRTNNLIKVLPDMPDVVLVGGADLWQGTKIAEDGFFAWTRISSYVYDPLVDPLNPLNPLYVHQGQNDIAFVPGTISEMYVATDGGVTKAITNIGFQGKNKNYKTSQFFSVAFSAQGDILAGSKDNGTLVITGDGNTVEEAEKLYGGDGGMCAVSMIDAEAYFITQPNGFIRRTVDNGANWRTVLDEAIDAAYLTPIVLWESFFDYNSRDSVIFVADTNYNAGDEVIIRSHNNEYPFAYELPGPLNQGDELLVQDPVAAKMFFGGVDGVWMTDEILDFNNDPRWAQIAEFVGTTQALAVSRDGDVVYAGTQDGMLYRMSNISSYTNDTTPNDIVFDTINEWAGRIITSISFSPSNANRLVVTLGNYGNTDYVYGTDNALAANPSFFSMQGDLDAMPVYTSLIELNHQDRLMVGTEIGIWSVDNWGNNPTWAHETDGIPDVPVFQLKQQTMDNVGFWIPQISGFDTTYDVYPPITNYGVIYAATHGRGLFKCENFVSREDDEIAQPTFNSELDVYPNPASDLVNIEFRTEKADECHIQVFDISGRVVYSKNIMIQASGLQHETIGVGQLKPGTYVFRVLQNGRNLGVNKLVVD